MKHISYLALHTYVHLDGEKREYLNKFYSTPFVLQQRQHPRTHFLDCNAVTGTLTIQAVAGNEIDLLGVLQTRAMLSLRWISEPYWDTQGNG